MEAGGLISYGADLADTCRRSATDVDRVLKRAKPADLPVEPPTKFELEINLKTAKQIGITSDQMNTWSDGVVESWSVGTIRVTAYFQ